MKYILGLVFLIISFNLFGQNPPGYQSRIVRERIQGSFMVDSTQTVPRYCGTPSGVRGGGTVQDGSIAIDTCNHRFYIYSNGGWIRMASFTELTTAQTLQQVLTNGNTYTNSGSGNGIAGTNSSNGNAISINNSSTGIAYHATISAAGYGSFFQNTSSGTGHYIGNTGTGKGVRIYNSSTGIGLELENSSGGSGNPLNYMKDNVIKFSIVDNGLAKYATNLGALYDSRTLVDKNYVDSSITAGGGSQGIDDVIATDPELTVDREILLGGNEFAISDNPASSYYHFLIRPSANTFWFGDISSKVNGTYLAIRDTATVTPRWIMTNVQEETGPKSLFYDPSNGKVTYDDATGGISASDTATMLTPYLRGATEGFGIDISGSQHKTWAADSTSGGVTSWVRTKKIIDSLNAIGSFQSNINSENWYSKKDEFAQSQSGDYTVEVAFSAVVTPLTTDAPDGWMYGFKYSTSTSSTALCRTWVTSAASQPHTGISISSSFRYNCGWKIQLSDLSDGTDTYYVMAGFVDATQLSSVTDGIYFRYAHADSSGQWIIVTESNNSKTERASGVTVAADTDYELEISVYNGTAYFWINKTLVSIQLTTNIPTGSTRATGVGLTMEKSAGTTAREMYLDWGAYGVRKN